jgi:AAA15 family ATPase/GTPase
MLLQFNFRNYKSFRDDASLDLKATKISEHSDQVVSLANNKILRLAIIYGANASGKSNVYDAFFYMTYYVVNSFKFGGETEVKSSKEAEQVEVSPFMFDVDSQENKSTFEVIFVDQTDENSKTYQYGFSLRKTEVLEEWLNCKTKTAREFKKIFYRDKNRLEFEGIPPKSKENITIALEKETLVVSLGARLKIPKLKVIRDWFYQNEVIDFSNPAESFFRASRIPAEFAFNTEVQNKVVRFFESFDDSIKGFEVKKVITDDNKSDGEHYQIRTQHRIINSDKMALIPLQNESQGTLEMFSLYPSIEEVLKNGSVLFVDELNTKLHPLLVRNIIRTFLDPEINIKNAQLIFTTHDVWQMENDLLRRDEIWFTEKDSNGVSKLFSLAELSDSEGNKIRKDENYEKNYLNGKYGAIPYIKEINMFKDK